MRKLGVIVLIIVALVVIVAFVVPSLVDINRYHDRIQSELQKRLGRPVSLGSMHLSLLPLAIRVDNAVIGEDPAFHTGHPFAEAQELDVRAKLLPLLHRDVQVESLKLQKPQIELVRDPRGTWNFASLGHPSATPQTQPSKSNEVSISDLEIVDGQIAITDFQKRQPRTVYDHIDVAVKGYAPDQAFDLSVAAHLPGTGAQRVSLSGKAGPVNQSAPANTPFDGKLKLDQVSISALQKFLNNPALSGTDAIASGETHIRNQQGRIESDGNLALSSPRIRNIDIGYPITAQYNISDDLSGDVLQISKGSLKLGSTPLSVTGSVNLRPTPADVDLRVNASNVSIEEAARLAAAAGVAFSPGMTIKGQLNADVHAQGPADQPAMNGTLSVQNLDVSGKELPQPVKVDAIQLALSPQSVRSNDFSAMTGGTRVDAQFTLTSYTSPNPNIDLSLRTNRANVGELLNMAKAYGASSLDGMSGSGVLTLNVHATGPVKNSAAMNFSGNGQLQSVSLKTPELTQPLGIANANIGFTSNSVVLQNLAASVGDMHVTGSLSMRNFTAPQVQFALAADKANVSQLEQMFSSGAPQQQRRAALSLVSSAYAAGPNETLLTKASGNGTLNIGSVIYDQLVLNNLRSNVALDHGVVRIAPLTADVYGGQETGSVTIDTRPTPMTYQVDTKLNHVDANKLISSVSSIKQTLYGLLAANANTSFRAAPADQIARTLNGNLSLDLRNGRIVGMDLLNELASIGKFVGFNHAPQQFTNLVQLTGNFNVVNGLAQTNDLKAVIDGGTLAAQGAVNLAEQTLNMHATAVLSQTMSKMVGGTGIGGMMQTALANNRGELVIPVLITGTFQHPSFAPDVNKIAQMKLQNMLPTSNNPGALTSGILGAIMGNGGQGQQNQGGLGGILGSLGGQQQQQQQQNPQQQRQKNNPVESIFNQVFGGQQQQQQQPQQQNQPQR
jgi:AsmA protein